jgi:hypothetical protein
MSRAGQILPRVAKPRAEAAGEIRRKGLLQKTVFTFAEFLY